MEGLNLTLNIGHLAAEPELSYTQTGSARLPLRLACGRRFRNREGNWVEKVEFVPVEFFGKRAEGLSKILGKGSRVFVQGEYRTYSYETTVDGKTVTQWRTSIRAKNVLPLTVKGRQVEAPPAGEGAMDDEVDFDE